MPKHATAAAAVATALLVTLAGCTANAAPSGAASPTGTAPSTATPTPTDAPATAVPPAASAPAGAAAVDGVIGMGSADRQLEAGRYRVDDPIRPFTITLPASWTLQTAQRSGIAMYRTEPESFAPALTINRVHDVYADPCHPAPGPSQAMSPVATRPMVVTALTSIDAFDAGPVTELALGGHPASSFVLTNALTDSEASECTGSPLDLWESGIGRQVTNQRARDHIWVVDVNGVPVTIDAQTLPGRTPEELVAEVEAIVASIQYLR